MELETEKKASKKKEKKVEKLRWVGCVWELDFPPSSSWSLELAGELSTPQLQADRRLGRSSTFSLSLSPPTGELSAIGQTATVRVVSSVNWTVSEQSVKTGEFDGNPQIGMDGLHRACHLVVVKPLLPLRQQTFLLTNVCYGSVCDHFFWLKRESLQVGFPHWWCPLITSHLSSLELWWVDSYSGHY